MRFKSNKRAHFAAVQYFLCLYMCFCKALVLAYHQVFAAFPRGGRHGLTVCQGGGHGLFTQHMLACAQCLNGHGRVRGVGRAHTHGIYAACQQLVHRAVRPAAESARKFLGPAGHKVVERGQLAIRVFHIFGGMPYFGDFSAPDNTYFNHFIASLFKKGTCPESRLLFFYGSGSPAAARQ